MKKESFHIFIFTLFLLAGWLCFCGSGYAETPAQVSSIENAPEIFTGIVYSGSFPTVPSGTSEEDRVANYYYRYQSPDEVGWLTFGASCSDGSSSWVQLLDCNQNTLYSFRQDAMAYKGIRTQAGAVYYICAHSGWLSQLNPIDYSFCLAFHPDPEGETAETALSLQLGHEYHATLASDEDVDCFTFHAGDESHYVFVANNENTPFVDEQVPGNAMNPYFHLDIYKASNTSRDPIMSLNLVRIENYLPGVLDFFEPNTDYLIKTHTKYLGAGRFWSDPAPAYRIQFSSAAKLVYDANGGSGEMDPAYTVPGSTVKLDDCLFQAPDGYEFDTWSLGNPYEDVTITEDTVCKALWKEIKPLEYTVVFNANGGTGTMDPVSVVAGTTYVLPECGFTPPAGKEFDMWNLGPVGKEVQMTCDLYLLANWKDNEPEPEPTSVTVAGGKYELAGNKKSAIFTGPEKKNARTLVIQDAVKIGGKKYKVTEVAAGACKGMSKLITLTIGKNVKIIGKQAFYKCKKAKTIKILGTALKTVGKNAFGSGYSKVTVYCAKKKIKAYTKLLQNAGLSKKAKFKELK